MEEHTSELQSHSDLVCRLLLEKKKTLGSAGHEKRLSPTRARAEYSSLAITLRERFQISQTFCHIAYDIIIGHSSCRSCLSSNILWRTVAELVVDVGANC